MKKYANVSAFLRTISLIFKSMGKGAFNGLKDFFGMPLIKKAEELNYTLDNLLILKGKMDELKTKYPDIYENIYSCNHNRDKRSPEDYAKDLVASWLFEDYMVYIIDNKDFDIKLDGADKNRHILKNADVKSDSDYIISRKCYSAPLELVTDYNLWWKTKGTLELRDNKFNKMNYKSILLGVSILDRTFFILDLRKGIEHQHFSSYRPFGGKPADRINLKDLNVAFLSLDKTNIIKEVLKILYE